MAEKPCWTSARGMSPLEHAQSPATSTLGLRADWVSLKAQLAASSIVSTPLPSLSKPQKILCTWQLAAQTMALWKPMTRSRPRRDFSSSAGAPPQRRKWSRSAPAGLARYACLAMAIQVIQPGQKSEIRTRVLDLPPPFEIIT